jgi:hypothetical protein
MRIERIIYSVLILAASVVAINNWRKATLFAADNAELRLRVEALEREVATTERLFEMTRKSAEKFRAESREQRISNAVAQAIEQTNQSAFAPQP